MHSSGPSDSAEFVKVAFSLDSEDWHGTAIERLWAVRLGPYRFRLDNVPFYAEGVACGDVVRAIPRDGNLMVEEVVERNGHETCRIIFCDFELPLPRRLELLRPLVDLGCRFEGTGQEVPLYAIDVPPTVSYLAAKALLEAGVESGVWEFEESSRDYGGSREK